MRIRSALVFTDNPSSKVTAAQLAKNALLYLLTEQRGRYRSSEG